MKKYLVAATVLLQLGFVASSALAAEQQLTVDPQKSVVKWLGKKVTGQHDGVVRIKEGRVALQEGKVIGGEFLIDMSSISNNDIESESNRAKLENHLKSDDFFNISQFPEAKFEITDVLNQKDGSAQLTGNLTVKGITVPVSFPATIEKNGDEYRASGKIVIDRTKWDIRYNSASFFDPQKLADKLIYDDIEIEVDVAAKAS